MKNKKDKKLVCLSTHIHFSRLCHEPSFIYFNDGNINMRNNFICRGGVISIKISKICDKDLKLLILKFDP